MLLAHLVAASTVVTATRSRREKIATLAACLRAMAPDEVAVGASYLAGRPRQERLDVGWRTLRALEAQHADEAELELLQVHNTLEGVAAARGSGSRSAKAQLLTGLLRAATHQEQQFLNGLILGELRQGALEGVVAQAIAQAWGLPEGTVRRAWMLCGDLGTVAAAAAQGGAARLDGFSLTLFRPLQPMLAQTAASASDAVEDLGRAIVDFKLDGARIQVHRDGDQIRVFTRNLRDVTARSPEVVAVTAGLRVTGVVLDGEVMALRPDGTPQPFQDTMARFGSDVAVDGPAVALVPFFFDCLHADGVDLLDEPLERRREALARLVPDQHRVWGEVVAGADAAEAVYDAALRAGHEGIVVKDPASPYEAGRRGAAWRKVKPTHTLDLVVLAVEWGSGRRSGWLSNLHLGARDAGGGFVMLGKTFKGMTDAVLDWQTKRLLELETHREGHIVHVRPELVVEVAFDGIQTSTRYPGGVALRFARVKAYRQDKSPAGADTIDTVRAIRGDT
ncbi:MAG: ATP-dependent DNA ligase [Nitriliruptorales bacterium]|nr:ATP-dependent DNA ligase [Nitriliruptorales bacterium]